MTEFSSIQITKSLLDSYCYYGEIELVKSVDYSDFFQSDIKDLLRSLNQIIMGVDEPSLYKSRVECYDFLGKKLESSEVLNWNTKKYIISKICMGCCTNANEKDRCVHKIVEKDTKKVFGAYYSDIKKVVNEENLPIQHFN